MAYNKKAVLEGNTEAIRVILRLEKERREATEAEKVLLRGYQGVRCQTKVHNCKYSYLL